MPADTQHWEKVRKLARPRGSLLQTLFLCKMPWEESVHINRLAYFSGGADNPCFLSSHCEEDSVLFVLFTYHPRKGRLRIFPMRASFSLKTSEQTSVCCPTCYLEAAWEQNSFENVTHQAVRFNPLLDPVNNCSSQVAQIFCWPLLICSNTLLSCFLLL